MVGRYPSAPRGPGRYKIPPAQGPVSLDTSLDCALGVAEEHDWRALVVNRTSGEGLDRRGAKADWHSPWLGHNGHPARGDVVDRSQRSEDSVVVKACKVMEEKKRKLYRLVSVR